MSKWWSITVVKITFGEDPEREIKEIRELLDDSDGTDNGEPKS
jgi:hypothetical protein